MGFTMEKTLFNFTNTIVIVAELARRAHFLPSCERERELVMLALLAHALVSVFVRALFLALARALALVASTSCLFSSMCMYMYISFTHTFLQLASSTVWAGAGKRAGKQLERARATGSQLVLARQLWRAFAWRMFFSKWSEQINTGTHSGR